MYITMTTLYTFKGENIYVRESDGYINILFICMQHGKSFPDWEKDNQNFINEFECDIVYDTQYFAHKLIAFNLANWVSPTCFIQVIGAYDEYISRKQPIATPPVISHEPIVTYPAVKLNTSIVEKIQTEFSICIVMRHHDGYINAGKLIGDFKRKHGLTKTFKNFIRVGKVRQFVERLQKEIDKPIIDESTKNSGTYIHPILLTYLACWLSVDFGVKVTQWIEEWKLVGNNQDKWLNAVCSLKPDAPMLSLEKQFVTEFVKQFDTYQREVLVDIGITGCIDVLTDTCIYECKGINKWHHALGQILSYRESYPNHTSYIVLFGYKNQLDVDFSFINTCYKYNVTVLLYCITQVDAALFIKSINIDKFNILPLVEDIKKPCDKTTKSVELLKTRDAIEPVELLKTRDAIEPVETPKTRNAVEPVEPVETPKPRNTVEPVETPKTIMKPVETLKHEDTIEPGEKKSQETLQTASNSEPTVNKVVNMCDMIVEDFDYARPLKKLIRKTDFDFIVSQIDEHHVRGSHQWFIHQYIFHICYYSGIGPKLLLTLNREDIIDYINGTFTKFTIFTNTFVRDKFKFLVPYIDGLLPGGMVNRYGTKLTYRQLSKWVEIYFRQLEMKNFGKLLPLDESYKLYDFKSMLLFRLHNSGMNISDISMYMHHKNICTTEQHLLSRNLIYNHEFKFNHN
jgi:hypothetical protein